MKTIKRIITLITALAVMASMAVTAVQASPGNPEFMLAIGDSITTGYGLEDYMEGESPYLCSSYANMVANALGLKGGESYINKAVSLGYTCRADEIEDRLGGVATSAESADSGKSGVIPTVDHIILNEVTEISLGHYGICNVETCELSLLGFGIKDTDSSCYTRNTYTASLVSVIYTEGSSG